MANEVLVKFRDPDTAVTAAFRRFHDFDLDEEIDSKRARVRRFRSRSKKVAQLIQDLSSRSDVLYVEPNYIAEAYFVPNDTFFPLQWHLDNPVYGGIHAQQAWDFSTGAGVTVAVVDTGVAYENYQIYVQAPDLAGTLFVPGYDFINNDAHANDDNNHGTHVTGTIAQSTNNALGTAGVAFGETIMPVKVLSASGSGSYAAVANGITFAADNGAKVINMSLGGPAPSQTLLNAVQYAYGLGVTIVAAAGNDGIATIGYPAAYSDYVIAVGATRYDETLSYYSNYGQGLSLVAPGGDVTVDQNGDLYGDGVLQQTFIGAVNNFAYHFFQGTSMATPHVAGVAALVIANGVSGPAAVRQVLETTADDLGAAGWDSTYGWGLVNAAAAVQAAGPTPDTTPPSQPTGLTATPISQSQIDLAWNASTDDVGVVGYNVYRDNVLVTTVGGLVYPDTGLAAATNYLYEVSAVDAAANESIRSSAVAAVTPALPPPPQQETLTIVDGFDEKNDKTLVEDDKVYVLLSSDDDRSETEAGYYCSYEFSNLTLPPGAVITSVEIFVEHHEESGFSNSALEWRIGTGWPNPDDPWATSSGVPVRKPEQSETVDSWDVTGFITAANLNLLEFMVKNNDNNKKTKADLIYAVVNFTTAAPPTLQSITVIPAVASIEAEQTQAFTATGHYSDSSTQDLTGTAAWSSSNTLAATISAAGLATGVAAGSSNISATHDAVVSNTAALTVTAAPPTLQSIAVSPAVASIEAEQTQAFTATGHYSDSSTQDLTGTAAWSSSNTLAATISAAGLATGVAAGSSNISATHDAVVSNTAALTVTAALPPPAALEITLQVKEGYDEKNSKTLSEDGKLKFAQVNDTDRIETIAGYFTSFEFDSFDIPGTPVILSVEISVVHYEEDGFGASTLLEWGAGLGDLTNPSILLVKNPTLLIDESSEGLEVFEVGSKINEAAQVNDLKFVVRNNDVDNGKITNTDHIFVTVRYTVTE